MNSQKVLEKAFHLLLDYGESVLFGSDTSVKSQALGVYLSRLLRPVWQLNIVAVDANGDLVSNADYFKLCQLKVHNMHELLLIRRNMFIGANVARAEGE